MNSVFSHVWPFSLHTKPIHQNFNLFHNAFLRWMSLHVNALYNGSEWLLNKLLIKKIVSGIKDASNPLTLADNRQLSFRFFFFYTHQVKASGWIIKGLLNPKIKTVLLIIYPLAFQTHKSLIPLPNTI